MPKQAPRRKWSRSPTWYTDVAKLRAFQVRQLSDRSDILYAEAFERTVPWVGDRLPLDRHLAP